MADIPLIRILAAKEFQDQLRILGKFMTLEIKIPSELEQQLHQAVDPTGVSADVYL